MHALEEVVPLDADVTAIEVSADINQVTIRTTTPGLVVGRRGATATAIQDSLRRSSDTRIELRIEEVKEPPEDPFAGVSEPRDPLPVEPQTGVQLSAPGN
jgi:ribosomal protein S3